MSNHKSLYNINKWARLSIAPYLSLICAWSSLSLTLRFFWSRCSPPIASFCLWGSPIVYVWLWGRSSLSWRWGLRTLALAYVWRTDWGRRREFLSAIGVPIVRFSGICGVRCGMCLGFLGWRRILRFCASWSSIRPKCCGSGPICCGLRRWERSSNGLICEVYERLWRRLHVSIF